MVPNTLASVLKSNRLVSAAGGCTAALLGGFSSTLVVSPDISEGVEILTPGPNRSFSWQPLSSGYFMEPKLCGLHREHSNPQQCSLGVVHSTEVSPSDGNAAVFAVLTYINPHQALSAVDGPGLRYVVHLGNAIARPAVLEQGTCAWYRQLPVSRASHITAARCLSSACTPYRPCECINRHAVACLNRLVKLEQQLRQS
jgi:hypothetical protein